MIDADWDIDEIADALAAFRVDLERGADQGEAVVMGLLFPAGDRAAHEG